VTARAPFAVAARELLRTTLLDAAHDLLADRPWSAVTMADVAAAAGVSRQTLYNEFGSRDEFAQAYVLREGDRFLAAVEEAVDEHVDDPAAALSAAFLVFLEAAAENPLVREVVAGDAGSEGLLPLVTTHGQPLIEHATGRLATILEARWQPVDAGDVRLLAESAVRLAISYAMRPAAPAAETAAAVTRLLDPFVERALAGARARQA
jgi:AcrR family transcriptional regulator